MLSVYDAPAPPTSVISSSDWIAWAERCEVFEGFNGTRWYGPPQLRHELETMFDIYRRTNQYGSGLSRFATDRLIEIRRNQVRSGVDRLWLVLEPDGNVSDITRYHPRNAKRAL